MIYFLNTRNRLYLTHKVKHKFAENSIRYQLPIIPNKTPNNVLDKLETHSNIGYKLYIKNWFGTNTKLIVQ